MTRRSTPEGAARLRLLLVGVGLVALAVRLVPLLVTGTLTAAFGYDDGVHLALAEHLVAGDVPYRDVLFVHPPGIALALSPVALLARVFGDVTAIGLGRLLVMLVGTANAVLVGWVLRRRGSVAVVTGGLMYALWGAAIAAERSIYLEPFIGLGLIVTWVALARRPAARPAAGAPAADQDRGADPHGRSRADRRRLLVAGLALGVAVTFKVWVVLDLAMVGFMVLARYGVRGALRWAGWCLLGAGVVLAPFAALARGAMWDDVVGAQVGRPRSAGLLNERLAALDPWSAGTGATQRALLLGLLVVLLLAAVWVAWRVLRRAGHPSGWPDPVWWAVIAVVHVVALIAAPSYYLHYAAFLAPPVCLLGGAGAGAAARWLQRRRPGDRGFAVAALGTPLVVLLVALGLSFPAVPAGPHEDPAVLAELTRTGCTWSDNPSFLLAAGVQTRMIAEGCPGQIDLFGVLMAEAGGYPFPGVVRPGESSDDMVVRQLAASRTVLIQSSTPDPRLDDHVRAYLEANFTEVATTGGIAVWQRPAP